MPNRDQLLRTIETIHAAGLDEERWPQALAEITRYCNGIAATLEVFNRQTVGLIEFHSFGLPPANELAYVGEYASLNPRIPSLINGCSGDLVTDYGVLHERDMNYHPFYADFLAPAGYRYFVGGILNVSKRESSLFSVQRATRQGHVSRQEAMRVRRLLPHVRQAFDVARRLRSVDEARHDLEATLDRLTDGVILVRLDGTIVYANDAFQAIARHNDGVSVRKGAIEFTADAKARYAIALAALNRLRAGDASASAVACFAAARRSYAPAYVVSLGPLGASRPPLRAHQAAAIVFIRDPLAGSDGAVQLLREMFDLTPAEAVLARALQRGVSPAIYARESGLSPNTVYTHLRRIKEKTGWTRTVEICRKLNELRVPSRLD